MTSSHDLVHFKPDLKIFFSFVSNIQTDAALDYRQKVLMYLIDIYYSYLKNSGCNESKAMQETSIILYRTKLEPFETNSILVI